MKLSDKELDIIAQAVGREMDRREKKRKKQEQDWRLHNTRLLLKHYRKLQDHCSYAEKVVSDEVLDLQKLTLESLLKCRVRTIEMMEYVDDMLKLYKERCLAGMPDKARRWRVLEARFLAYGETTIEAISTMEDVAIRTVYDDIDKAIDDLSVYLWGYEALHNFRKKLQT
ncbi:hypothetical protein NHG33_06660 [Aerococcaceae bacterium NML130460]|nr:hypothetical protein [Aerococcaceae bacterium NML130460]